MSNFDLLVRKARVLDPANGIDAVLDIALKNGLIAAIGKSLDTTGCNDIRDLDGYVVTPGLIDLHTHVYWGGTSLGIDAEEFCRQSSVTTAVDTGSAGPGNFPGFRKHVIEPSAVRILCYLHVSHSGIFGFSNRIMVGESENIRLLDPVTAVEVVEQNRDVIVGIKIRLGRHASGDQGMTPFQYALQVAQETGLPMMVHIDEPPPSYREVVAALRPGDVLTHCFRPFPNSALSGQEGAGVILPEVVAARERGVYFDIGHGMGSFSFSVARRMLEQGFLPDTISSDIHKLCIDGPVFDQLTTLSKFLNLGMSLSEVLRCSTVAPAQVLQRPELGSLAVGAVADLSILEVLEGDFEFQDSSAEIMRADRKIVNRGVVLGGNWWHTVAIG